MRAQSRSKNLISQVVQPTIGLVPKFKCQEIRDRTLCQCCSQSGIRDVVELTIKSYSDISGKLACQREERRTVCKRVGCVSRRGNRIVHRRGKRCVVCRPIPVTHAIVKFLHPEYELSAHCVVPPMRTATGAPRSFWRFAKQFDV